MYNESDFSNTSRQVKLRLTLGILLICLFLAALIVFTILRLQIPALACGGVGFIVCYFLWSFKIVPWLHYNRFMKEMRAGQRRSLECELVRVSPETRTHDNVEVRDVLVAVGKEEEDERLFVLDADKTFPDVKPGDNIKITSYGSFITDVALI